MNERDTLIEDFSAAVRAIETSVRPWKIATGVLAVALVLCIVKIVFL